MSYIKQQVLLYKQEGNGFSDTPLELNDCYDIQIESSTDDKKDSFQFKITNANNKYFSTEKTFEIGDRVVIYIWKNKVNYDDTDLQMDGVITDPKMQIDSSGRVLTIKGFNRLDIMFDSLVFISRGQESDTITLPELIVHIIREVNSDNLLASGSEKKIKYIYKGLDQDGVATAEDDTISDVNSAGVAFSENVPVIAIYRKAFELIKDYSSPQYTKDGEYDYWMDEENYFHWGPRNTTITSDTLDEGSAEEVEISISKDDIVTALIINVGVSPSGRGNTTAVISPTGVTKHGARWKFITEYQKLSEDIMTTEEQNNPSYFDVNIDRYPITYPYTTYFKASSSWDASPSINVPAATKDQPITVNTDKEYDGTIRKEAEVRGEFLGEALLEIYANPKYEAALTQKFNKDFGLSSFIPHTIQSYNFTNKNLRLKKRVISLLRTDYTSNEDVEDTES